MDSPQDVARVREIRSLLERIQQLPIGAEGLATPQAALNPYFQQWPNYHSAYQAAADTFRRAPSRAAASINPWLFVLATVLNTLVAAVLAVLITLSVVRQDPPRAPEQASSAPLSSDAKPGATPRVAMAVVDAAQVSTPSKPIEVQPIGSPARPLRLEALRPAPLPLVVQPKEALAETFILVLSGVPAKANLKGADRIGADSWLLSPNSMSDLQITMPEWSTTILELGIELRRTNGVVAARSKAWIAVPPPQMPKGEQRIDQAALKEILQRGDQLLSRGDIVAARAVYQRAAELGSGPAALALGSTYDPSRLWSFGVFGMVGNKDKARQWYARADQLGHPNAKDRLKSLGD